jgi:hypothetical protein
VIPFLGGCRLAETDRAVARNYITALQEEGRSANTIRQAKVVRRATAASVNIVPGLRSRATVTNSRRRPVMPMCGS